ncbi:1341_t:CDS:2, partial [Dentiscutata heterogama]
FDIAFDSILNLLNVGILKTNKEKPLTSEQINNNINKLRGKLSKPLDEMVPASMPFVIQEECWKESDDKLIEVTKKILETFKNIWCNPAFRPEFFKSLNEGTYVNNIIVLLINAVLYNNPSGELAFITTLASANRRGDGRMGRKPDIMFITKENEDDDYVKLWHEVNDGMFWVHKSHRLTKKQCGIIGIQVTGCTLRLNTLIRDEVEVHRYYKLRESKIPIQYSNDSSILTEI